MMNRSYISFLLVTILLVFSFAGADSIKNENNLKGSLGKEKGKNALIKKEKDAKQLKTDFSVRTLLVSSSSSSSSSSSITSNNKKKTSNVNHISGVILNDPNDAVNSITDERKEEMESPSNNNNQEYKCVWKDKKYKVGEDAHCDPDHPKGSRKRCKFVYCKCQSDGSFADCHN